MGLKEPGQDDSIPMRLTTRAALAVPKVSPQARNLQGFSEIDETKLSISRRTSRALVTDK
jgi:hypothetical protein